LALYRQVLSEPARRWRNACGLFAAAYSLPSNNAYMLSPQATGEDETFFSCLTLSWMSPTMLSFEPAIPVGENSGSDLVLCITASACFRHHSSHRRYPPATHPTAFPLYVPLAVTHAPLRRDSSYLHLGPGACRGQDANEHTCGDAAYVPVHGGSDSCSRHAGVSHRNRQDMTSYITPQRLVRYR
jgi:hypothetical protein